jgi:predicted Ser/Thr protein kinase
MNDMAGTSPRCAGCGVPLAAGGIDGFCRQCLGAVGFGDAEEFREDGTGFEHGAGLGRLGNYRLLGELGSGGMGVVYRARQAGLDRDVALKVLRLGPLAGDEGHRRFRQEAAAAAALKHPNIVTVYEVGEVDGHAFLSMELVEGRTLAECVREGPLVPEVAARYLAAIADAVATAHAQGIVHRDLKPANVLIDAFDAPRVTDFGLAKRFDEAGSPSGWREATRTGQVLGSPGYMPPEQADPARGAVGFPADIYAMGALLYHLLTGRAPFAAATVTATIAQVLSDEPVPPRRLNSGIPADLETICLKCLAKEPGRRYATAHALAEDLRAFRDRRPIQARPVSVVERVVLGCRRKPVLASLILALGVVGTAGLAGVLWQVQANRLNLYAADLRLASEAVNVGDLGRARELLLAHEHGPGMGGGPADFVRRYLLGRANGDGARTVGEHPWIVGAVAWSPDGRWVASASVPSGTVEADLRLWDPGRPGAGPVVLTNVGARELGWFPDSKRLLAMHHDGVARIWDGVERRVIQSFPARSGALSRDGRWLALCEGNPVAWEAYLPGEGPGPDSRSSRGTGNGSPVGASGDDVGGCRVDRDVGPDESSFDL